MVLLGMQALVTLLPQPFYQTVTEIWSVLEERYGCKPEYNQPEPHFTWQYADSYNKASLSVLESLSAKITPFEIETDIVSSFSGDNEVFFVRIVPSISLKDTHRRFWNALHPYAQSPSLLYQPENWTPHITLTMHAETANNLKAVREYLNTLDLQWKFSANHLTMLSLDEENSWKDPQEFQFGK